MSTAIFAEVSWGNNSQVRPFLPRRDGRWNRRVRVVCARIDQSRPTLFPFGVHHASAEPLPTLIFDRDYPAWSMRARVNDFQAFHSISTNITYNFISIGNSIVSTSARPNLLHVVNIAQDESIRARSSGWPLQSFCFNIMPKMS